MSVEELEQRIRQAPEDLNNYLVYSDLLQEQGDPRGELMALQHARFLAPDDKLLRAAEYAVLDQHRDALLGPLAENLDCLHLDWHLGFIRSARLFGGQSLRGARKVENLLEDLLQHPSAKFLTGLSLGSFAWRRVSKLSPEQLLEQFSAPLSALESLFVFDDFLPRRAAVDSLTHNASQLQRLSLHGRLTFDAFEMNALRALHLHNTHLAETQGNLLALREGACPLLEELAIGCPDALPLADLMDLLANRSALRTLRIWNMSDPSLVTKLLESPMAAGLEVLDLTGCGLQKESADKLTASKASLAKLQRLIVDGNHLATASCKALHSTYSAVQSETQIPAGEKLPYWSDSQPSFLGCKADAVRDGGPPATDALSVLAGSSAAGRMLYNRASLLMMEGEYARSLPMAKASLEFPDAAFIRQAWQNVGIVSANQGDYEAAVEIAKRSLLIYPLTANPYAILIDALRHLRHLKDALVEVERGKVCIDDTAEGMALLQDCMLTYLMAGKAEEAGQLYTAFAKEKEPRPQLKGCAALVNCHLDPQGARALLAEAREEGLEDPMVDHALACLAMLDGETDKARALIAKARAAGYVEIRFAEEEDPILCTLGLSRGG